ncbi:hypothetical protein GcC1_165016 [Golovinomyces cichoracearum]|uniref:Uncharacterized protein n=1 Tax=Golovinomyces cichoracearum TaxID=62708 RepID=A0A420HSR9_9PEZI|nr:hypothetical protein GcC1_165016 [Golovinomyces cichoracearum]
MAPWQEPSETSPTLKKPEELLEFIVTGGNAD